MRAVVVGAGAWGTAVAHLLRGRGHDVFVARRDALVDAPYTEADLVVLAVPSHAFREVLPHIAGDAPILSLTKGLDPSTGERLSTLVGTDRSRCSPGRTWPRRWLPAFRVRP